MATLMTAACGGLPWVQARTKAQMNEKPRSLRKLRGFGILAERTGLEPATPGVTGRYSNQLNYRSKFFAASGLHAPLRDRRRIRRLADLRPAADSLASESARVPNRVVRGDDTLIARFVAERTGLEPATPGVTGRYSNQLNYRSALDLCRDVLQGVVGAEGIEPTTFAL